MAYPIVLAALPWLIELAKSRDANELESKKLDTQRHIANMQAEIIRLEIESDNEKVRARKEIIQSLIDAATHALDRKLDAYSESFNRAHALIDNQQQSLLDEKLILQEKLYEDISDSQFVATNRRLSEIATSLIDLKKASGIITREYNEKIESANLNLSDISNPRLDKL